MPTDGIRITGLAGIPEIRPGDDIACLIAEAYRSRHDDRVATVSDRGIVMVVAQKVVSKAEGCLVNLNEVVPSTRAQVWANQYRRDARIVEVVLREARRVVRMDRGVLIVETPQGFVCANGGVDASNAPPGTVVLLPRDPDQSARRLRDQLESALGLRIAVIISDTFGRPWRHGLTNVALGVAGLSPFIDYRGQPDTFGRPLQATLLAVADELASAGELVMGKTLGVPVAVIEGFRYQPSEGFGRDLIRPEEEDLFR